MYPKLLDPIMQLPIGLQNPDRLDIYSGVVKSGTDSSNRYLCSCMGAIGVTGATGAVGAVIVVDVTSFVEGALASFGVGEALEADDDSAAGALEDTLGTDLGATVGDVVMTSVCVGTISVEDAFGAEVELVDAFGAWVPGTVVVFEGATGEAGVDGTPCNGFADSGTVTGTVTGTGWFI
ncbi:hypothetical protein OB236_19275 [Paenibacillus sp. WQ 127069]|uniref:Uncharacterized protein n=1 Tax=Paenibacillus baimaensis TaxID=2982185 RepID=A0ABT2UHY3_9BACL|nr:hypothetical protein [Paenibacillus sp. WQ 127069]MCU6794252.1 hypothetical protein [Paenibacillus sp. WQ 127069]